MNIFLISSYSKEEVRGSIQYGTHQLPYYDWHNLILLTFLLYILEYDVITTRQSQPTKEKNQHNRNIMDE